MRAIMWSGLLAAIGCGSNAVELLPDSQICANPSALTSVPSNLVVLVDRSASMNANLTTMSRWDALHASLASIASTYQDRVRFGVALYPGLDRACNVGGNCQRGQVFADLPATVGTIDQTFDTAKRCSNFGKPTDTALDSLIDYAPFVNEMRSNYVLLVTDGKSSCNDPSASAARLQMQGPDIRTFVIGFGNQVDATELAATAAAGRTGTSYYQIDDEPALANALDNIARRARSCTYSLGAVPIDPARLVVELDGRPVARNTWMVEGSEIKLVGASCESVRTSESTVVTVSDCSALQ